MSGQTQPETALQALAEKLRTDAIAIFGEGQAERDIIEWFYAALLAAAPATPAAQVAVPDVSAMARVLSDRAASACCVDPDDNWKIYGQEYIEDVRAMLAAAPAHQAERKETVCPDCLDTGRQPGVYGPHKCRCNASAERQEQGEVQRLREMLERATKLLSAAAGYATKMEPMPAKLLNAIDTALDACPGQEVGK